MNAVSQVGTRKRGTGCRVGGRREREGRGECESQMQICRSAKRMYSSTRFQKKRGLAGGAHRTPGYGIIIITATPPPPPSPLHCAIPAGRLRLGQEVRLSGWNGQKSHVRQKRGLHVSCRARWERSLAVAVSLSPLTTCESAHGIAAALCDASARSLALAQAAPPPTTSCVSALRACAARSDARPRVKPCRYRPAHRARPTRCLSAP